MARVTFEDAVEVHATKTVHKTKVVLEEIENN